MPDKDYEKLLGDPIPPPRNGFERALRQLQSFCVGRVPVGAILIFLGLFALPAVVIWHALDLLPYWVLKALLIAVTAILWSALREWRREVGDRPRTWL
jgi:hypothetical protein